jgi:hypothetical protein
LQLFFGSDYRGFLDEAGNTLDGFVAERALGRGKLKCMCDLVLEVARRERL